MLISSIIFGISLYIIFFAMIGYPVLLNILDKTFKPNSIKKDTVYEPTVSFMIVAHNEERVIRKKLENTLTIDYPREKFEIIVASDNSSDLTNQIVKDFIEEHPSENIVLYVTEEHKGKTNAQNEAQKVSTGEILVMTDANSMFKSDAVRELVSAFTTKDIAYVCGRLAFFNADDNATSQSEATYWNMDLKMRDIESRFQTITAGNGAIYACRNSEYFDSDPLYCHDSVMPFEYALNGKKALFNPDAIAYEKAGESNEDEFKRKVRMNRDILSVFNDSLKAINVFKHKWFSLFYFGHRTCRYLLWLAHSLAFVSSAIMAFKKSKLGMIAFVGQIVFWVMSLIFNKVKVRKPLFHLIGYYGMTVFAQGVGVWNILTGKSKPIWEKAESTR